MAKPTWWRASRTATRSSGLQWAGRWCSPAKGTATGTGWAIAGGDCDDGSALRTPGNVEICNSVDDDCDLLVDEDGDGDGVAVCADCDDGNPQRRPGAAERCNAVDDDCDATVDEGSDADGDGVTTPCDCNDANNAVKPGATETCNRWDDDCDGVSDESAASVVSSRRVVDPEGLANDQAGYQVAALPDVTGDGVPDFVTGNLYDYNARGGDAGSVVLYNGATRAPVCRMIDPGGATSTHLGWSVAVLGDVSGDGTPDVIAASPYDDENTFTNSGSVSVFSGANCAFVRKCSDPGSASSTYLGYGANTYGGAIAGMPDLDGDGKPEIVAGVPYQDRASTDQGEVLVFSSATCAVLRRMVDPVPNSSDYLGGSVAGIADVTGDGTPDILAGSYGDDTLTTDAGAVLVFSGADGSLARRITDAGGAGSDYFGQSLAVLPDINGNGFPDLAVGAIYDDTAQGSNAGSVVLVDPRTGATIRKLTDPAGLTSDALGASVASAGDLTGDGIAEIVAGAPNDDTPQGADAGSVVLFDGASGTVIRKYSDAAGAATDHLGYSVTVPGDLSGDGEADVVAGVPDGDEIKRIAVGRAVVFAREGDCDGDGVAIAGGDCDDGSALRTPGKVEICNSVDDDCDLLVDEDGDGDGAAVCADCDDGNPQRRPGAAERCNAVDDDCDATVDEGSDADGDGVTTPCDCNDADNGVKPGATETCDNRDQNCDGRADESSPDATTTFRATDPAGAANDEFGFQVAVIRDVTGDGRGDLVVSSRYDDNARGGDAGSVALLSGADRSVICRMIDPGGATSDYLGWSVAVIGDVSGDGTPDVIAASPYDDENTFSNSGSVSVFSGANCAFVRKCSDPGSASSTYLGYGANTYGGAIAGMPDLDGDGKPEIVAGVPYQDRASTDQGEVLVFSSATCAVLRRMVDPVPNSSDYLGGSVAGIADVTGDGTPDILAGSYSDDALAADAGAALVFSGADGSLVRRITDAGGAGSDYFGQSLAVLPDVNGDGFPDLAVGAIYDDTAQGSNAGSVVLVDPRTGATIRSRPIRRV